MMTIPYPFLTPDCYGMSLPRQWQSWQDRNPRHLDRAHVEAVFREMKAQKQQPVRNERKETPNPVGWREKLSRKYVFLCLDSLARLIRIDAANSAEDDRFYVST